MKKSCIKLNLLIYLWLGVFSLISYFNLFLGASNNIVVNKYWLHNVIICFLINVLVFNLFKKKLPLIILSIISFIWSTISYFVLQLHGGALCFSLFKNFRTAISVVDSYHLSFSLRLLFIIVVFAIGLAILLVFPKKYIDEYKSQKIHVAFKVSFLAILAFYSYFSYTVANTNMSWAPFFIIENRGYMSYLITDSIYCFNHFNKPDGYDEALIPTDIKGWDDNVSDTRPDIIVILNESFSDISKYSDVKLDSDPLASLNDIDNLHIGYCITPNAGGGTNTSEYELLTSNSTALLSIGAPFNFINFEKHNASIVPFLEKNDYSTYAFHCYSAENYNRKIAYTAMGFDNIYLGPDKYENHHKNGNRDWLDSDNYADLIRVYNESDASPKFMYLLTYQNHGGYEQNTPEMDTIHSIGEYTVSNDIIDEYMSSVALSAQAFKELTDYYATVKRPVIICMVGDHNFSYCTTLNTVSANNDEKEIADRTVPYLVWSNFDMDTTVFTEYTSMIDLVPSVLYSAGIPLDDYYKQVLNLHEMIPGLTTFGVYIDNDKTVSNLSENDEYEKAWNNYLFAEYKRLKE